MIIHFGKLTWKHLLIIIFPIFLKLRYLVNYGDGYKRNFKSFNDFLSLTFCGIIHLISQYIVKASESKKTDNKKNKIELRENKKDSKNKHHENNANENQTVQYIYKTKKEKKIEKKEDTIPKLLFILLISILQVIPSILKIILYDNLKSHISENIGSLLQSLFFIIFSLLFLGFSLYIHQFISLIIISTILIIFDVQEKKYQSKGLEIIENFQSFLYLYAYQKLYCLSDILGKKYLNMYMDGLYLFLFKIGIIGLILIIIYDVIAKCIIGDEYNSIINCFSNITIWMFLFNFSCYIFFEISLWLTIYYFSPLHYIILEVLGNFLEVLLNIKTKVIHYEDQQFITFIVLYPILFFAALVFNEIIILNFCGLNYNTKLYIAERGKVSINYYNEINGIDPINEDDEDNLINENDEFN